MRRPERLSPRARQVIRALGLGIAVSLAVTAVSLVPATQRWEKPAVDLFLHFRSWKPSPEIVLVVIDEEAFKEMGERQPVSRRYLAELGDFLLRSGARVVAFDLTLRVPSVPEEDAALLAMLRRWERAGAGRVVFGTVAQPSKGDGEQERYNAAPPFSPEVHALFGFTNTPGEAGGVIRDMLPVLPARHGGYLPSFALAVLAASAGHSAESLSRAMEGEAVGGVSLPVSDPNGGLDRKSPIALRDLARDQWRIDFGGLPRRGEPRLSFTTFPSGDLVGLARSKTTPAQDNPFRGKIVLVGATFEDSRDFHSTPLGIRRAGVEIQGHMVQTLLLRRALLRLPLFWNLLVMVLGCLSLALLSLWLRPAWLVLVSLVLMAGVVVGFEVYTRGGYWLDFVVPLVGMMAYLQGSGVVARRRVRAAFGQFVGPEVVDRIIREGTGLGGELRTATVLMSDLRGFTTLSERLPPGQVSDMMNEYFTAMVEVILAHKGMVNDFIGDGIIAIYGAPGDDPDHAWHGVTTALGMQAALARLNAQWQAGARGPLAMGVAVHTGEVFAGNLGSPRRKKYTVLGDTVNTVARIEGLNRDLSTAILISGATLAAVKGRVVVRDRGAVPVKGRAQPVEVFELLGLRDEADGRPGG